MDHFICLLLLLIRDLLLLLWDCLLLDRACFVHDYYFWLRVVL